MKLIHKYELSKKLLKIFSEKQVMSPFIQLQYFSTSEFFKIEFKKKKKEERKKDLKVNSLKKNNSGDKRNKL